MSKKMLKRSLALGALMAFVITGSAMAAEPDYVQKDMFESKTLEKVVDNVNRNILVYRTGADSDVIIDKDVAYRYVVTTNNGDRHSESKVLAQQSNTTGKSITFSKDASIYLSTDAARNMTGRGSVFGVDVWDGTWNFNGQTDVEVHAVGNENTNSATSAAGVRFWGNSEDEKAIGNFSGNTKIVVTGVDASDGQEYIENGVNVNDLKGLPGNLTGIFVGTDSAVLAEKDFVVDVKSLGEVDGGNSKDGATAYGVDVTGGAARFNGATYISSNSKQGQAYGLMVNSDGYTIGTGAFHNTAQVELAGDTNINVIGAERAVGIYAEKGSDFVSADLTGANINITATAKELARGVIAKSSNIVLGGANSNIKITLDGGFQDLGNGDSNPSVGVWAWKENAKVAVNGQSLTINGTVRNNGNMYGIIAQTTDLGNTEAEKSNIVVNAKDTFINIVDESGNAAGAAIVAMSEGKVDVKGNVYASAEHAVLARGNAKVGINTVGSKDVTVQLDGDIYFGYADNSGSTVDADVDIKLANANSYLKGNIIADTAPADKVGTVTGMKLTMTNGATWELDEASVVNEATFGADSNLVLLGDGNQFTNENDFALNGVGTADVLKVDSKANIKVEGIDYKKYNVATGFEIEEATTTYWNVSNLNSLMQGNWIGNAKDGLQLEVVAKAADQMEAEMGVSTSTAQSLANVTAAAQSANVTADANGIGDAKAVALVNAIANAPSEVAGQAFEAVSKMAEAGGNSGTAASIVKNVTGVTNDRLSFNCGHSAPHKGGHGVGLFEEGSGADVWVEYVHGKDEVEDMPSTAGATSYEGQYNGIVMGVDFKKVNKFQSGVAFNYGEGDTNSVGSAARTRSDYDFWGIGYYGSIHNDDSNVIFDIGYAKTDSDVETNALGINYKASPETTTWTAGVKLEKLYQNENVQIVPYTGLRFMSIDPEDYSTECASTKYQMERQNVWMLPLGVSIRQEIANDNGWTVSPKVDLSYIWAFGDTDSEMEFSTLGTKTNIGYEVMDDGSFLGLVGIEAHKGQWGFGVSYSYQKGDYSTSKKWFIDANYSF